MKGFYSFTAIVCITASMWLNAENIKHVYSAWDGTGTDELIASMTDEELAGQLFLFGYMGHTPSKEILSWIQDKHIGGIKIFGWNASDLSVLARSIGTMQKTAMETDKGIPLIIATDQEGGWVRHVKGETSITPGALSIGATGLPYDAYQTGLNIGIELKTLGINMNFAPTVDIYLNPNTHVIGPRSFSSDPVKVGVFGQAFFRGLEESGIIATAKHFPGHGNAEEDSHGTMPVLEEDIETLRGRELIPYRFLIREGIPSIMSGHLAFPRITSNREPASLSRALLTGVLREELGFDGVIVTDDLKMHGAQESGMTFPAVCEKAVRAGNDILMISRSESDKMAAYRHILSLTKNDSEFRSIVTASVRRIIELKKKYLGRHSRFPLIPDEKLIETRIPSGTQFYQQQAFRSITLISRGRIPLVPQNYTDTKITIAGQFSAFLEEGKARYPGARLFSFSYSPFYSYAASEKRALETLAKTSDLLIFCLATPGSIELLKSLEPYKEKVFVISTLTPVYLAEVPWVESALAVYGTGRDSFTAGFSALAGDFEPTGILPVPLSGSP
ncbi:MAG: glycoside hydrolase family 3 protein [Spirochaetales bacterium]|nr:glycoside hydrolase family 3 protein [Spirochaetales bacterium]